MKMGLGVSCFVSSGNEADLHCEDYFRYLAEDKETKVILSYIEGFRDGRRFLEVAREVTRKKPLIMLKAGCTSAGAKAALSHTAALAGSDTTFNGVVRQVGVMRAQDIDHLSQIGAGFIRQPLPRGRRVGIITAGGGWGVLAADACSQAGLEVIALPDETIAALGGFLPSWWNPGNPVDLVAALRPDHLWKSVECLLQCEAVDGLLLLGIVPALPLNPFTAITRVGLTEESLQALVRGIREAFEGLMELAERHKKPVIVASEFPVSALDLENRMAATLGEMGCVCYFKPEDAARVMASLATYAECIGGPCEEFGSG
jgi:acyl-CoA synthetase (NDP forming)